MGFSIFPGINKESVHYKFMERGDLVYYIPNKETRIFATIEGYTRDDRGTPQEITLKLIDGTFVTTSIKNILY